MTDTQKNINIIAFWIVILFWSFWFFSTHQTRSLVGGQEIGRYCGEKKTKTEYCLGFAEGYNWAAAQVRMDKALQEYEVPEDLKENKL